MMSFRVCQVGARDSVAAEPGSLAWPGLGRTPLPFCGEDGEAEKQDAEQAGKERPDIPTAQVFTFPLAAEKLQLPLLFLIQGVTVSNLIVMWRQLV